MKKVFYILTLTLLIPALLDAQYYETLKGSSNQRKKNVHSGNQIRTTFFNYGFVGRINQAEDFGGEWPINTGHFYVGDISIMVGAEVIQNGSRITPVTVADGPRGNNETDPENSTIFWGWEPLPGFSNPDTSAVAMSHKPQTWPSFWPDRENDENDPGWPAQWNGFFGKDQFNADQESYWVMDDYTDKEWIRSNGFKPDANDSTRGGLALLANVRGLQWSQTLAQNTIFWLYDVTNIGTTDYEKSVFGMIVGTTIGGDGDTDDDNSKFDALENITYSWDADNVGNTGWSPVGYMGYAFLESPGNKVNGFDDDNDGANGGPVIDENFLINSGLTVTTGYTPKIAVVGEQVVTIDYTNPLFERSVISFPADGITISTNNTTKTIMPGDTLREVPGNNIDDNLNGLVDENTEIPDDGIDNNNNTLIDEKNPQIGLAYIDYLNGASDNPMIDEGRDDGIDNDGDWNASIDDVGLDGKAATNDFGERDGLPTSGYQPNGDGILVDTGLPGEPNIDKTDIDESDQIGLTSFFFFTPFNLIKLNNDSRLWSSLRPGFFDDGLEDVDGDFLYGTAYFPLFVDQTERISLAFFFGNSRNEIFRTKNTVQLIYNNDYNFAKAPLLPTLSAAAGDKEVTLYWDSNSEESFDKLSQEVTGDGNDFEGYKVYRATFPTWDETGIVTNVFGSRISDVPVAQFDLVDADSGFFPVIDPELGSVFYLGDNTGLRHIYRDTTVNNGFTYFYAVTAYDKGINFIDPLSGELKILQPSETSKFAAITTAGTIELAQNVIVVRPEAPTAGYVAPPEFIEDFEKEGDASGRIILESIDPLEIKSGRTYQIGFNDDGNFLKKTKEFYVFDITNPTAPDTVVAPTSDINIDATVFDGIRLRISNDWITGTFLGGVGWADTTRNILPITQTGWGKLSRQLTQGKPYPANYQLEVGELGVDTTAAIAIFGLPNIAKFPTNFRIKNISEDYYVKFNIYDLAVPTGLDPENGILDQNDIVVLFEYDSIAAKYEPTYQLIMSIGDSVELPQPGDILNLPVKKPFLEYDKFTFTVQGPEQDIKKAKNDLSKVKVVPNPYIAAASWEGKNNFSTGRGDRAIHFTNLPQECTIRIYSVRGELVAKIDHISTITNGTADWDLLSLDQLDVAYGVYIYHIDAKGIGEKVGKFAIIK